MIATTETLYRKAKEYQDKRKAIMDEYENRVGSLETAKGSQYFTDETKKAEDKKIKGLKALKAEYGEYFNACLTAMHDTNRSRKMTPPTEEELRTLQLLKMKDRLTEAELEAAANTLKGNATCLSVLTEMSHNAGYFRNYDYVSENKEMPVEVVERTIRGLASSLRDFMEFDTNKAARMAENFHIEHYGSVANESKLPKRPLFDNMEDCYKELTGLSGDALEAFENAVDD